MSVCPVPAPEKRGADSVPGGGWMYFNLQLLLYRCSLRMISRQTRMAAKAPMLSLSVWPSCTNSQLAPQKPSRHRHWYRSFGSRLMHVAPFRHGRSRHSFRSMQPLPSGDIILPSPHLYNARVGKCIVKEVVFKMDISYEVFGCIFGGWWPLMRCWIRWYQVLFKMVLTQKNECISYKLWLSEFYCPSCFHLLRDHGWVGRCKYFKGHLSPALMTSNLRNEQKFSNN